MADRESARRAHASGWLTPKGQAKAIAQGILTPGEAPDGAAFAQARAAREALRDSIRAESGKAGSVAALRAQVAAILDMID